MPMTATSIDAAARTLLDHRTRLVGLGALPDGQRPETVADAYSIQDAVVALRVSELGAGRIGYKIGATNQAARDLLGVEEPFFGVLFDSLTTTTPASIPAASLITRVVEPEIAIELAADLDPAAAPFDAAAIRAATRALMPAIEVVDTAYAAWNTAGGPSLIADNAAHGRWIVGPAVTDIDGLDPAAVAVTLTVDGRIEREGVGANVDGGAYGAAAWLATALARRGIGLKAGDRITTGTATPPIPAEAGQTVVADFAGLGRVEIAFT